MGLFNMNIHVALTAVIYHVLNGRQAPAQHQRPLVKVLPECERGQGPAAGGGPWGPLCLEWKAGGGGMGQDVSGCGDPSRHPRPVGVGVCFTQGPRKF